MAKDNTPAVLEMRLSGHEEESSLRCVFSSNDKLEKLNKMNCRDAVNYILDCYENTKIDTKEEETNIRTWLASRKTMIAGKMKYKRDGKGPSDLSVPPSDMERTNITKFFKEGKDASGSPIRYGKLVLDQQSGMGNYI